MISTVGKYLDALYVSVRVPFPEKLQELFRAAKLDARGCGDKLVHFCAANPDVPGDDWYIRPVGSGLSQFVLENGCFWLGLSVWDNMPTMQLQFKANTLYEHHEGEYAALVENVVDMFFGRSAEREIKVSRCDLAVDFQGDGFKLPRIEDVSCRARYRRVEYQGERGNTLTLGRRNQALQSQIYCKSEELQKSGKMWMFEVWKESPEYRDDLPVWRTEVRFYREGLRAFGVDTIGQLLSYLGDLAKYSLGTEKGAWMRVMDPDEEQVTKAERKAAGWWTAIVRAFTEGLAGKGRKRKGYDPKPSIDRCLRLAGSMVARAAALHLSRDGLGYGEAPTLDAGQFFQWAGDQYEMRLAGFGQRWADQVNTKKSELRAVAYS